MRNWSGEKYEFNFYEYIYSNPRWKKIVVEIFIYLYVSRTSVRLFVFCFLISLWPYKSDYPLENESDLKWEQGSQKNEIWNKKWTFL